MNKRMILWGYFMIRSNKKINPMNIYAKEDKPCHGIMLFYNKRK